ncbi:hypothetical protein [Edaphocola aurantiacus]|uniref:hypothetical protein n=1 Tax=Edaphocola aurantiacus TaxID=2601682 RepID=UPI001C93AB75|nr:hypothetical protein [Edaphocola aurantiacus]
MYRKLYISALLLLLTAGASALVQQSYIRKNITGTWLLKDITLSPDYYRECEEWKTFLNEIEYIEEVPDHRQYSSVESYKNYLKKYKYDMMKEEFEEYKASIVGKYAMIMTDRNRVINILPDSRDTSYWYTERQDSVIVYDPARIGKEGDITRFIVEYISADSLVMRRIDNDNEKVYYLFKKEKSLTVK